jgi:hypothetical protein
MYGLKSQKGSMCLSIIVDDRNTCNLFASLFLNIVKDSLDFNCVLLYNCSLNRGYDLKTIIIDVILHNKK